MSASYNSVQQPAEDKFKFSKEKPQWCTILDEVLETKENKEFLDAKNIVLATVTEEGFPRARYHVHRGWVKDEHENDTELLLTTTDAIMPKVGQIKAHADSKTGGAPAEYIFWMSPTGDQIRVQGYAHLWLPPNGKVPVPEKQSPHNLLPKKDFESYRTSEYEKLSAHLRASFLRPKPGSDWPNDKPQEFQERLEIGGEGDEEARGRFSLVVFEPTHVDRSQQNAKPPFRHTFTKMEDGSWKEQKVVP